MLWVLVTVGFIGFNILVLRGPVERHLDKAHMRKMAKLNADKKMKALEARVNELENQVAEEIINNHE